MLWQQDKQDLQCLLKVHVQEVMDLAAVAHLAAIKGRVPFCKFL